MPKPAKKPAAKRRQAARQATIALDVLPPPQGPSTKGSEAEHQAFCALVATGTSHTKAYQVIRPHVTIETAQSAGSKWAEAMAGQIQAMRQAAQAGAALVHGVTQAYLVGHAKAMLETPLAEITPESIYCKKHKVTTTSTDAGPKTTVEVEKPCPLATLQALAKLTGHAEPPPLAEKAEGQDAEQEAERRVLGRVLARIVTAGSPIQRRVADTKKAEE